jgi:ACS family glucarate transporter-like MFS transporter
VTFTRIRLLVTCWMFVIGSVAYLDRVNISIAGVYIQEEFNLSNVQLGWVFSAFLIGYTSSQLPGGVLVDRFGARRSIAFGIIWASLLTAGTGLVSSVIAGALTFMIGVRFLLGIGEAVIYPASNRIVTNWIPTQERGLASGVIFASIGVGAGITPPVIRYVMENYGWRSSFWLCAGMGVIAGAVWVLIYRDRPEEHPWVGRDELRHIQNGRQTLYAGSKVDGRWKQIAFSKDMLAITFSHFTYGYTAYIFLSWFFIYLGKVRGMDLKSSSYYAMLPFMAMAVASPLGGAISDRLTKSFGKRIGRCLFAAAGMGLCAVFIAIGIVLHDLRLACLILAGGVGSLYLAQSSIWSVTADLAGSEAGKVSAVMNMGGQFGGALTASLTPWIADNVGWSASFLTAAGLCMLGGIAWLLVNPDGSGTRGDPTMRSST